MDAEMEIIRLQLEGLDIADKKVDLVSRGKHERIIFDAPLWRMDVGEPDPVPHDEACPPPVRARRDSLGQCEGSLRCVRGEDAAAALYNRSGAQEGGFDGFPGGEW
jgi:hypothetical protein